MLSITEKADEMIQKFFQDKPGDHVIRIYQVQGGWSGPSLGMALDEPQADDEVVDHKGIKYLVNKGLLDQVKPINVDFIENERGSGFSISSNLAKGDSCGGSCSC